MDGKYHNIRVLLSSKLLGKYTRHSSFSPSEWKPCSLCTSSGSCRDSDSLVGNGMPATNFMNIFRLLKEKKSIATAKSMR